MSRPPTIKRGPASIWASAGQTIVEVWSSKLQRGFLLSIRETSEDHDGPGGVPPRLIVEAYRGDPGTYVRHSGADHAIPGVRQ